MRRILRKLAKSRPELIGRFNVGDTTLEVAVDNNLVIGLVNGYRVVDAPLASEPSDKILSALASIAAKLFHDRWGDDAGSGTIDLCKAEWDSAGKYPSAAYMQALQNKLSDYMDASSVRILDGDLGQTIPEEPATRKVQIDLRVLLDNMAKYTRQVEDCLKQSDRVLDRASILLARNVTTASWGGGKIQAVLEITKESLPALTQGLDSTSRDAFLLRRAAEGIAIRIRKGIRVENDDTKYMKNVLIPDMLSAHDHILSYIGSVVASLSTLSNLDMIVRNNTGYPASFMFKMSLIDDLNEAYAGLVHFLADMPQIEKGTFEPLEYIQHGTPSK